MSQFYKGVHLSFVFFCTLILFCTLVQGYSQSVVTDSIIANKYYDLAIKKDYKGEFATSNTLLFKASKIFKNLNLHDHYIDCQYAVAWNFKNLGEFDKSDATALDAILYGKQNNLDPTYARVFLRILGQNKSHTGDYKAAEKYFLEGLRNTQTTTTSDSTFLGWLYNDLGNLYYRKHDLKKAIANYNRAILFKLSKSDFLITKGNIGMAYSDLNNYPRAISTLNDVINEEIKLHGKNSHRLVNHYINIGKCYIDIGDAYAALEYYEKSLLLCASNPNGPVVGKILDDIGVTYLHNNDYKKALVYFDSALHQVLKLFDKNYTELTHEYNNLAATYQALGDYEKALSYHNKSLQNSIINKDTFMIIRAYNRTAETKVAQKKYNEAMRILNGALRLSVRYSQPSETYVTYNILASVYAHYNDLSRAIENLNQGIQVLMPTFKPEGDYDLPNSADALVNSVLIELFIKKANYIKTLGFAKNEIKTLTAALATFELGIDLTSQLDNLYTNEQSRIDLHDNLASTVEDVIELCYQLFEKTTDSKYLEKAFYFSEKNKAVLLRQNFKHQYAMEFSDLPDSLCQKENDLKSLINFYKERLMKKLPEDQAILRGELFDLKSQYARLMDLFKTRYPKFYELKYKNDVTPVDKIQKVLPDRNSVMIKYFLGDSAYYIYVITKNEFKVHRIKNTGKIELSIQNFLTGINQRNQKLYADNAWYLYNALIKSVQLPKQINRLIIIPDGKLSYVPFEAFIKNPPENKNYAGLSYLLRDYVIQYHISATLMVENASQARPQQANVFGAFAPVEFNSSLNVSALVNSESEVKAAASLMDGDYMLRGQATEAIFKNTVSHYTVLHLATHTIIDDQNPLQSKILFFSAGDSLNDGVLHNYELYNIKLKAKLVTLSACNTGVGKITYSEGVMSLARAFMYAGSPGLIMTLWPTADKASQVIMNAFYKELATGKDRTDALRDAKLLYLSQSDEVSSDPFLWSSFVFIGDEAPQVEYRHVWLTIILLTILSGVAYIFWNRNYHRNKR